MQIPGLITPVSSPAQIKIMLEMRKLNPWLISHLENLVLPYFPRYKKNLKDTVSFFHKHSAVLPYKVLFSYRQMNSVLEFCWRTSWKWWCSVSNDISFTVIAVLPVAKRLLPTSTTWISSPNFSPELSGEKLSGTQWYLLTHLSVSFSV